MFSKKVLATFCRSDKFKSFQKCVETFESIRSTTGCKNIFQKLEVQFLKRALNLVLIADSEYTQKTCRFAPESLIYKTNLLFLWQNNGKLEFRSQCHILCFLCLDNGGLKNTFWWSWLESLFLTDHKNIRKEIQEGRKVV